MFEKDNEINYLIESNKRELMLEIEDLAQLEGLRSYAKLGSEYSISADTQTLINSKADKTEILRHDGSVCLTEDWDIGNGRTIKTDKIMARDSDGLALFEDGDSGIFIRDGGSVGIGTSTHSAKLSVNGGVHVGGDSDPGDNNLLVDGTFHVDGASMFDNTIALNDNVTQADNKWIATDKVIARDSGGLALYEDGGSGIFIKDGGNVGIGTTDPGAKLEVDTTASVIGQIIKGASSQSSNLAEFRNSSGTVLACISKAGAIGINTSDADSQDGIDVGSAESGQIRLVGNPAGGIGGISSFKFIPKTTGVGRWWMGALADNFPQVYRRGNFEFYDINTKTPRFIIDSSGRMGINSGYTQPFVAALSVFSTGTTMPNLYLKAYASQTADMMQLINSSGTVLGCWTAGGKLGVGTSSPSAEVAINGGLHVGGDSDPGDNNLLVDGTVQSTGELHLDGDLNHDGSNVGFYGATPVAKQSALTTQLTTITCSAPGTPDYAITDPVQSTGFGFSTSDEMLSALKVIANLQTRLGELETRLKNYGLLQ